MRLPNEIIMMMDSLLQQKAMTDIILDVLVEAKLTTDREIKAKFERAMKAMNDKIAADFSRQEKEAEEKRKEMMDELLKKVKPQGEA